MNDYIYSELAPIQTVEYKPLGIELCYAPESKKITPSSVHITLPDGGCISLAQLVKLVKSDYENFHRRSLEGSYKAN